MPLSEQRIMADNPDKKARDEFQKFMRTNYMYMFPHVQEAITERNKHVSPLLRLPAELRMKIWEFAVGGHIIHCYKSILPRDLRCHDLLCSLESSGSIDRWPRFQDIFSNGLIAPICRQIRAEAVGLQFKINIFRFNTRNSFKLFLEALSKAQLESIREMSFIDSAWHLHYSLSKSFLAQVDVHSVLPSLKRIYLHRDYWPGAVSRVSPDADVEAIRKLLEEGPCLTFKDNAVIEVLVFDVCKQAASLKDVSQIFHL